MRITHKVLDMADYLRPNQIVNTEAKFVFMLRSRMMDVTLTPLWDSERDTQEHLLVCTELATSNSVVSETPEYKKLFGEISEQKISISISRKKLIKELIKNEEIEENRHQKWPMWSRWFFCGLQYSMYVLIWRERKNLKHLHKK